MRPQILLATSNPGKAKELAALLPPGVEIATLADLCLEGPEETGTTFAENAVLKAVTLSEKTVALVIADDSGLEVDALDGDPGVRSARYAGEPPDDQRNNALLLERLQGVPPAERTARFLCSVMVAQKGRVLLRGEGSCEGTVGFAPQGSGGFGYDPLFVLPDGRTMAELEASEKNQISHRAIAYRKLARELQLLLATVSFNGAPPS